MRVRFRSLDPGGVAFLSNRVLYLAAPSTWAAVPLLCLVGAFATALVDVVLGRKARRRGELLPPALSAAIGGLVLALLAAAVAAADWDVPTTGGFDYCGGVRKGAVEGRRVAVRVEMVGRRRFNNKK